MLAPFSSIISTPSELTSAKMQKHAKTRQGSKQTRLQDELATATTASRSSPEDVFDGAGGELVRHVCRSPAVLFKRRQLQGGSRGGCQSAQAP
jgi:hypothetical protein